MTASVSPEIYPVLQYRFPHHNLFQNASQHVEQISSSLRLCQQVVWCSICVCLCVCFAYMPEHVLCRGEVVLLCCFFFSRSLDSQDCHCNQCRLLHLNDSCLGTLLASPHLAALKLLSLKCIFPARLLCFSIALGAAYNNLTCHLAEAAQYTRA